MSARRERGQGNPTQNPDTPGLNLSELKEKTIAELNQIARDLNVQNIGGLRKQELIFKILQSQAEKDGLIYAEGVLEVLPTASASSGRRTTTTCRVPTTSTFHRRRSGASTSAPAIPSRARCGRRRIQSDTSRS